MNKHEPLNETKVLDDGKVALIDYMGNDQAIVDAARISYGKGTKKKSNNRGLIRYLVKHHHTSPLEQVQFKFFIRIPMDAWRQFVRHRTQSINEYSTRYSEAINSQQKTAPNQWRLQVKDNKQGSNGFVSREEGEVLTILERELHMRSGDFYRYMITSGVAREQARKDLPLSTYTEAYTSMNLHNLFHFLKLRLDSHAQEEIRQYAQAMYELIKPIVPLASEAFEDYILNAITFSSLEHGYIKDFMEHVYDRPSEFKSTLEAMEAHMSKRELTEFKKKLGLEE
jgi:thymidylate synthase (FAD)